MQLSLSMVKVDVHVLSGTLRGGISARCWFTCIHMDNNPKEWHQGKEAERESVCVEEMKSMSGDEIETASST